MGWLRRHHHYDSDSREPDPRFEYNPGRNIFKRILVGTGLHNKLASSKLVSVPYRSWVRYVLVFILALIGIFLTPQLLPKWLGFKWSTASDVCENREEKLVVLESKIWNMTNLPEGTRFIQQAEMALGCMELGANSTWDGSDDRILYPDQCIPENAEAETNTETFCIPESKKKVCVDDWGLSIICKTVTIPEKCKSITSTDSDSAQQIAELEAERSAYQQQLLDEASSKTNSSNSEQVLGTANQEAEKIINRLLTQIDIASNLYIAYCMLAILIGTPIVIYKRELTTRVVAATLGLRKANFVLLVVIILTIYDSIATVLIKADFEQLMANYRNDPCYLDPDFSTSRLDLIRGACSNVTSQNTRLDAIVSNMSSVYYDASLCEVCAADGKDPHEAPDLVSTINAERLAYENGTEEGYVYPGRCNATAIANATATPPESGVGWGKAILGSGILAQILLKGILATWVVHLVSYFEPMTMHRGMVEIYGFREDVPGKDIHLTRRERRSVYRFAKDKHIVPLIFWSMLLIFELVVIIYSAVVSKNASGDLREQIAIDNSTATEPLNMTCDAGKLVPG